MISALPRKLQLALLVLLALALTLLAIRTGGHLHHAALSAHSIVGD